MLKLRLDLKDITGLRPIFSPRTFTLLTLFCAIIHFSIPGAYKGWAKERERIDNFSESIKKSPTFHQKVEGFPLSLSPGEMEALLDDLPYASSLLRKYKIHSLDVVPEGDWYTADDRKGLQGTFRLNLQVGPFREYQGRGTIDNSLIGHIAAEVVATIHYTPVAAHLIRNDLEFWVLVNNSFLDFLCRLFNPLLRGALRSNVEFLVTTSQQLAVAIRSSGEDASMH